MTGDNSVGYPIRPTVDYKLAYSSVRVGAGFFNNTFSVKNSLNFDGCTVTIPDGLYESKDLSTLIINGIVSNFQTFQYGPTQQPLVTQPVKSSNYLWGDGYPTGAQNVIVWQQTTPNPFYVAGQKFTFQGTIPQTGPSPDGLTITLTAAPAAGQTGQMTATFDVARTDSGFGNFSPTATLIPLVTLGNALTAATPNPNYSDPKQTTAIFTRTFSVVPSGSTSGLDTAFSFSNDVNATTKVFLYPSSSAVGTTKTSDCVNRITRFISDYDSTDSWSPVDSLVFTSTMPIQPEIASSTNLLSGNTVFTGGSSNTIIPSFTDISLPLEGGATDYLGKITYIPSAQYRWLEFVTNQALTGFNFQLLWRNRLTDQLARVFLKPNGSVQMKLMLQRKF